MRILFSFTFVLLALPQTVFAASVFLDPAHADVEVGDHVEVKAYVRTDGNAVNALQGDVDFPTDAFQLDSIHDGGSLLTLWIETPSEVRPGRVHFSGVVPGGYTGEDGYLFSLFLTAKRPGTARLVASLGQALANDGLGTALPVSQTETAWTILPQSGASSTVLSGDSVPPQPFSPSIGRDASVFNGAWFVAFVAQDKESGIDHYELRESRFRTFADWSPWRRVVSPAVLSDQSLKSWVFVKAVDRYGNSATAILPPKAAFVWYEEIAFWGILVVGATLFVIGFLRLRKRGRKR